MHDHAPHRDQHARAEFQNRELSGLVGAPKVVKSVVHIARGALATIQSRFRHGRRRLVPVVP